MIDLVSRRYHQLYKLLIQNKLDLPERTLLVTGIPRSGTSLFSVLLNRFDGIVCFNEILYDVWSLPYNVKSLRKKLTSGQPVPNKYSRTGELATDTMNGVQICFSTLPVQKEDVIVGSNVNVPYLFRLDRLIKLRCPIIAIVRDPLYTIASWGAARVRYIPEAQVGPEPEKQHPRWHHMRFSSATAIERRAELWNALASIILRYRKFIQIIRYEDLVSNPEVQLERVASQFGLTLPNELGEIRDGNVASRFEGACEIERAVSTFSPCSSEFGYT